MRFLLRPGWIALTVAVIAFAATCGYLLAPWQFHRSTERDGANAAIEQATATAPVPRAELVTPGAEPAPSTKYRQVVVTGTYAPAGEVLVRLRSVDGGAASEVLTPLRTTDGQMLLVDRGYIRATGATPGPIAAPPAGVVTVVGFQLPDEAPSDRAAIDEGGRRQVYSANAAQIGAVTGTATDPGYVQLLAGQPGALTATPLPPLDVNTSYSYAWQWLIFGIMAVGGWVYVVRLEARTRREQEEPAPAGPTDPPAPAPRTTADVLADRYGRR